MEGSGRCETSRPPASQCEGSQIFIDFFFAAHVLFLVDGTRRFAVDDRRTAWRGCEFWQRVPHEAADREMFRMVSSDTTVFGSHGPALQYCNAWMLWLGPATLIFRYSSCLFRSIDLRAERWMSNSVHNLQGWSRDRRNASVRSFALTGKHFRLQHQLSGLCVLLTTDCCP